MEVRVLVNRSSSYGEIKKHMSSLINVNSSKCQFITFGCSFTHGKRIDENDTWPSIFKQRYNIDYLSASRCSAGLFQLIDNELKICRELIDVSLVKNIVVQRPLCLRYYWNTKKEKYHRRQALYDFLMLTEKMQRRVLRKIEEAELEMLTEMCKTFPRARFSVWRYWLDDCLPSLKEYSDRIHKKCQDMLGFTDLGNLVGEKLSVFRLNRDKYGFRLLEQPALFETGWVAKADDNHPSKKHNEIVAERICQWQKS